MNLSRRPKRTHPVYAGMPGVGIAVDRAASADSRQNRFAKALGEVTGLLRRPQRVLPLFEKLISDTARTIFEPSHLYSHTKRRRESAEVLGPLLRWILNAQRADGGIAAYYSLLTGYSRSYPEVTGYLVPTLFEFACATNDQAARDSAHRAAGWLLSLQMSSGAFPAGLQGRAGEASVFNTGQILQGLIRAHAETNHPDFLRAALSAGSWLVHTQHADGSWCGPGAYQGSPHTYYSMVSWALAKLSKHTGDRQYAIAADKNLDWVLTQFRPSGWIDGIHLRGHPNYLHFVAYALQGALECAVLLRRGDAVEAVGRSASVLLRKFEVTKRLPGAYGVDFYHAYRFTCLTGNAQMACVWLRLFELTNDLRYLNAALKMNEMVKQLIPVRGPRGIAGGVSGSYPIWARYQPLRYISWGCKFLADALLLEDRLTQSFDASVYEVYACAS